MIKSCIIIIVVVVVINIAIIVLITLIAKHVRLSYFVYPTQINDSESRLVSCLLRGPPGSGKTALAANVGLEAKFPFIKVVTAENMVGSGEASRVAKINGIFENAYRTDQSMIILDDIERLLDYVSIGPRFANSVLQSLLVLAKRNPPEGRKLLVIATSSLSNDMLSDLGVT